MVLLYHQPSVFSATFVKGITIFFLCKAQYLKQSLKCDAAILGFAFYDFLKRD